MFCRDEKVKCVSGMKVTAVSLPLFVFLLLITEQYFLQTYLYNEISLMLKKVVVVPQPVIFPLLTQTLASETRGDQTAESRWSRKHVHDNESTHACRVKSSFTRRIMLFLCHGMMNDRA
jgi:hypothetical protein